MSEPIRYASFLIRIWQENRAGEASLSADWHAEVEHIQSSQRWIFQTAQELLSFLQQQVEDLSAVDHSDRNKAFLAEHNAEHERNILLYRHGNGENSAFRQSEMDQQ